MTDTDRNATPVDEPDEVTGATDEADPLALAEAAEAEAAEAEAAAAAARARARALRLRRAAQSANRTNGEGTDTKAHTGAADTEAADTEADEPAGGATPAADEAPARSGGARQALKIVAMTLGVLVVVALLVLTGLMVWQDVKSDRQDERNAELNAEYAAAGRQSVVTLMSLNFSSAQDDVKRIIENSTGEFKTEFEGQAEDFIKVAQESKVVTDVTVNATAVESMDADSAVVLVAANSRVTNAAGANQEPRSWRLAVDLQREGDQIKMSKVEFVP